MYNTDICVVRLHNNGRENGNGVGYFNVFINLWDTMIRNNCRNTASYFLSREYTDFQIKGKFLLHHTELKLDSTEIVEITNEKKFQWSLKYYICYRKASILIYVR